MTQGGKKREVKSLIEEEPETECADEEQNIVGLR